MIKKAIENLKIEALNAMQLEVHEASKKPNDIILLSPTGSGKTVAFLLPILASLHKNVNGVQALIVYLRANWHCK